MKPDLYPFAPHFHEVPALVGPPLRMHYVDEGRGPPVVMLHGNPTWSFYYRRLIPALAGSFRVIAPDHIGCGLSDKPNDKRYSYVLDRRERDLASLLDSLDLKEKITLVVHDWGGMIGLLHAVRRPERIARIVAFNTACGGLPKEKWFPFTIRLARTPLLGATLVRGFNAFVRGALTLGCRNGPVSPDIRRSYLFPYDSWTNRIAVHRFVQDIPLHPGDVSFAAVKEVEDNLGRLRDIPLLIIWGEKDFVFDEPFLAAWRSAFPIARIHRIPSAGHLVLEDAPDECIPLVRDFLSSP